MELVYGVTRTMSVSYVVPTSIHGAGVWGYKNYDKLNIIHHRALRSYLGVYRSASTVVLNGEMRWDYPVITRKLAMLRLCVRLLNTPNNGLTISKYLCGIGI